MSKRRRRRTWEAPGLHEKDEAQMQQKRPSPFVTFPMGVVQTESPSTAERHLVAGPLVGYRMWPVYVKNGQFRLGAIFVSETVWLPGQPLVALCGPGGLWSYLGGFLLHELTAAPDVSCSCGIYAMRHAADVVYYRDSLGNVPGGDLTAFVCGAVSLWGHVVEHQKGYRAQYAYPLALWPYRPREMPLDFPEPQGWLEVLLRVGETYGVPVFPRDPGEVRAQDP